MRVEIRRWRPRLEENKSSVVVASFVEIFANIFECQMFLQRDLYLHRFCFWAWLREQTFPHATLSLEL